jgi:hypothetical protein
VSTRVSAQQLLEERVHNISHLRVSELIDCVAWAFLERFIFSIWIPGLGENGLKFIVDLDSSIERGGTFSLLF